MKVGITGQSGFIGWHLYYSLKFKFKDFILIDFKKEFFYNSNDLDYFVSKCDVIIHLAAVNRDDDEKKLYEENIKLASFLIDSIKRIHFKGKLIFSSSYQENMKNEYGKSKNEIRKMFISESKLNNFKFSGLLIPNVFGPFSKPNHNTFIATFCNKIINGKIPEIIKDSLIPLIYIDDLILEIINEINNVTNNKKLINPEIKIRVSEVLNLIKLFNKTYIKSHKLPDIKNKFSENLFNTFLSFIKKEDYYPVYLKNKIDERGGFFEIIREESGGQTSISYTFPNIIRGNHFHTKKIERFCVVKGEALIKIRKLGESKVIKFTVSGSKPSFIDIPIWHTHTIENIGKDELVTVFWINQHFDEKNSDTFSEIV